jgi:hypothetical protein
LPPRSGAAEASPGTGAEAPVKFPLRRQLFVPWARRGTRGEGLLLVLLAASLLACDVSSMPGIGPVLQGSGAVGTERREVEPFDAVSVEGDFGVQILVAPETSVTVTGDDNLLPIVRTEVRNGTLHVEAARSYSTRRGIRISLTTPSLRAVALSGSSSATARGFRAESFRAAVAGSSTLMAEGQARSLDVALSGSGDAMVSGSADRVTASVSGSGDLHMLQLQARAAEVSVSGSGSAVLQATEELTAAVSGSGEVRYAGTPRVTSRVTGSGSVEPFVVDGSSFLTARPSMG